MRIIFAAFLASLLATASAQAYTPWCGFYMMKYFGKTDSRLALAINWRHEGSPSPGPCAGCVVVWNHHVGLLTGQDEKGNWILHSGNDGNAVRTHPISAAFLRSAVAFRQLGSGGMPFDMPWRTVAPVDSVARSLPDLFAGIVLFSPPEKTEPRRSRRHR